MDKDKQKHCVFSEGQACQPRAISRILEAQTVCIIRNTPIRRKQFLVTAFTKKKPEEFFRFYRNKMLFPNAQPNAAHKALARLEQQGKLKAVITQNIDGLHQKAGSREVLELHGSVLRNYCEHCGRFYSLEDLMEKKELVPKCSCGGIIKPDVVLYEESLNQKTLEQSVRYISQADMLIVGGTSLTVYPAAGLIDYYRGNKLVLINMAATVRDGMADLIIKRKIGEALSEAVE